KHLKKDNSIINVEVHVDRIAYHNKPARLVLANDVTEGKRSEDALRKSETIMAHAQSIAHFGSWEIELHSQNIFSRKNSVLWSDEVYRIFGYKPGSIVLNSHLFFKAIHPDDIALVKNTIRKTVTENELYSFEHRIVLE